MLTAAAGLVAMGGCAERIATFSLVSTRNVDLSRVDTFVAVDRETEGEDVVPHVLLLRNRRANVQDAVDAAIRQWRGGVAMQNVTVEREVWSVFFYGEEIVRVRGTVLIDPRPGGTIAR